MTKKKKEKFLSIIEINAFKIHWKGAIRFLLFVATISSKFQSMSYITNFNILVFHKKRPFFYTKTPSMKNVQNTKPKMKSFFSLTFFCIFVSYICICMRISKCICMYSSYKAVRRIPKLIVVTYEKMYIARN